VLHGGPGERRRGPPTGRGTAGSSRDQSEFAAAKNQDRQESSKAEQAGSFPEGAGEQGSGAEERQLAARERQLAARGEAAGSEGEAAGSEGEAAGSEGEQVSEDTMDAASAGEEEGADVDATAGTSEDPAGSSARCPAGQQDGRPGPGHGRCCLGAEHRPTSPVCHPGRARIPGYFSRGFETIKSGNAGPRNHHWRCHW